MTGSCNNSADVPMIEIDLGKIYNNAKQLNKIFSARGISVMGVTKGVLGNPFVAAAMTAAGVKFLGDSRIENIKKIKQAGINNTLVLIRTPHISKVKQVVKYADISLNSELDVIHDLSEEAMSQNKLHRIIVMVDLGDLREGVLPEDMENTFNTLLAFKGIRPVGIGTNLGCVGAILPDRKKMDELSKIAVQLENRFNIHFDLISGGNSSNYQWFRTAENLGRINNLRIGEMIFTGCDTIHYKKVDKLQTNTICLVAEVIEVKNKDSVPSGTVGTDAFGDIPVFSNRGTIKRALLGIGRQDVLTRGLTPLDDVKIIGSSSDHIIIDCRKTDIKVGDRIRFHLTYGAQLSAMTSSYVKKVYLNRENYRFNY